MQDLSCVMQDLSLRHMNFLLVVHGLSSYGTWLLCSMWDLSSPTKYQTRVQCIPRWIFNHWTTREVPLHVCILKLVLPKSLYMRVQSD